MAELEANPYFKQLTKEEKDTLLAKKHQLLKKPEIKSLDAHELLMQMQKASLYTWHTKIAALPGQFPVGPGRNHQALCPTGTNFQSATYNDQ